MHAFWETLLCARGKSESCEDVPIAGFEELTFPEVLVVSGMMVLVGVRCTCEAVCTMLGSSSVTVCGYSGRYVGACLVECCGFSMKSLEGVEQKFNRGGMFTERDGQVLSSTCSCVAVLLFTSQI